MEDRIFHATPDRLPERTTRTKTSMKNHSVKPEITGTRSGYVIRFTCPACNAENSIVNKTPRDHYKLARDAGCARCRKRCVVTTPAMTQNPDYSRVPVKIPVTK
jgi:transcription elongation factor Elf1